MDLPIDKQLEHQIFLNQVAEIKDVNVAKVMLQDLHLSYLKDQAMIIKMAKGEFSK
jgi:hypothetical protein